MLRASELCSSLFRQYLFEEIHVSQCLCSSPTHPDIQTPLSVGVCPSVFLAAVQIHVYLDTHGSRRT